MFGSQEVFCALVLVYKDFRGTDIHHSDVKNALVQILILFCLLKITFQNLQNFLRRNACEIKIFLQFVEKIKELKPGLSKQHNKMLKIRSEMLEIEKNGKIIKLRKNCQELLNPIPGNPEDFWDPGIFFENFPYSG